jgi:3-isopropylmalate/(R)-2-methylmalate dehydratase small subunit
MTNAVSDRLLRISKADSVSIHNECNGIRLQPEPLPPIMLAILSAGGLVPYMRTHGSFTA